MLHIHCQGHLDTNFDIDKKATKKAISLLLFFHLSVSTQYIFDIC